MFHLEPCADVMVSAPARWSILVDGGAWVAKRIFFKDSRQNFVLSSKCSDDLPFSHRKLQPNNYAATMASAERRQIIGGIIIYFLKENSIII